MATRESHEVGIDHLTVVPENLTPGESEGETGEGAGGEDGEREESPEA